MSSDSDKPAPPDDESGAPVSEAEERALVRAEQDALAETQELESEGAEELDPVATQVGVEKYVHAAFFCAGILTAYLGGKILLSLWNYCADWPAATRSLPFLLSYAEDERGSLTLIIGAVVGLLLVLRYYRRPAVRSWATAVAVELARVTWPSKDTVTNGTIVVLVAGAIATIYIALLDRLWGYLTNLVYGA